MGSRREGLGGGCCRGMEVLDFDVDGVPEKMGRVDVGHWRMNL